MARKVKYGKRSKVKFKHVVVSAEMSPPKGDGEATSRPYTTRQQEIYREAYDRGRRTCEGELLATQEKLKVATSRQAEREAFTKLVENFGRLLSAAGQMYDTGPR